MKMLKRAAAPRLSVPKAAKALGVSSSHLRRWLAAGQQEGALDAWNMAIGFLLSASVTAESWEGPAYIPMRNAVDGIRSLRDRMLVDAPKGAK